MSAHLPLPLPLPYLRTQAAARLIGVSARMLQKRRSTGTGPKFSKIGGRIIYAVSDLREWIKLNAKTSTKITILPPEPVPDEPLPNGEMVAEAEEAWPAELSTHEAARFLGLSYRTVEKHRTYGTGPKYSKVGRRVVYTISDLQEWAQDGAKRSTSEPGETTVLPAIPVNKRGIEVDGGVR